MPRRASWAGMTTTEWAVLRKDVVGHLVVLRDAHPRGEIPTLEIQRAAAELDRSIAQVRRYVAAERPRGQLIPWDFPDWLVPIVYAHGSVLAAYEELVTERDACCALGDEPPPELAGLPGSYDSFLRAWKRLPIRTQEFGKRGAPGLRRRTIYLRWEATERNEIWQADATKLDVWVLPRGHKVPVRPWIVLFMDDHTRIVTGAILTLAAPNAEDVATAFVRAVRPTATPHPGVWVGGVPGQVLIDNGTEFKNELMGNLATAVGTVLHPVARYTPTHKGKVERLLGSLGRWVCMGLPGYTRGPRSYTNRDVFFGEPADLLNEGQLWAELDRRIEHYNNRRIHRAIGSTPLHRWATDTTPLTEADPAAIRHGMLLVAKRRRAEPDGVRIAGGLYMAVGTEYADHVGEWVRVARLPHDDTFVEIYTAAGKWICTAYPSTPADTTTAAAIDGLRKDLYRRAITDAETAHGLHVARAEAVAAGDTEATLTNVALSKRLPETGDDDASTGNATESEVDPDEWLKESRDVVGSFSVSISMEALDDTLGNPGEDAPAEQEAS